MFNQTEKSAITVVWPHNTKLLPVYSNSLITQPMENDFHSQCLDTLKKKKKKEGETFSNMEKTIN